MANEKKEQPPVVKVKTLEDIFKALNQPKKMAGSSSSKSSYKPEKGSLLPLSASAASASSNSSDSSDSDMPLEAAPQSYFSLTVLGTCTAFKAEPIMGQMTPEIDPMSYLAQISSQLLNEDPSLRMVRQDPEATLCDNYQSALAYESDSIAVLDGVEGRARNNGQRVAEATLRVLDAVARGKTHINLTGHSRGGVVCRVTYDVLDRIKNALLADSKKSLYDILLEAPPGQEYIALAMKNFIGLKSQQDTPVLRAQLAQRMGKLYCTYNWIDPVPGNAPISLLRKDPAASDGITWFDPCFPKPIPMVSVKDSNLFICLNELSCSFRPLVSQGMIPTVLTHHHGGLMGNDRHRNLSDVANDTPENKAARLHGRDLFVLKSLEQMRKINIITDPKKFRGVIGCVRLNALVSQYLSCFNDKARRDDLLIKCYESVIKAREDKVCDPFLDESYLPWPISIEFLHYENKKSRILYNYGQGEQALLSVPSKSIDNELTLLKLGQSFEGVLDKEPLDQIRKVQKIIADLLIQMHKRDAIWNKNLPLADGFCNPLTSKETDAALSSLLDVIVINYLKADLEPVAQARFIEIIGDIVSSVSPAKTNFKKSEANEVLTRLSELFKNKLGEGKQQRYKMLTDEKDSLKESIDDFIRSSQKPFSELFEDYLNALPEVGQPNEAPEEDLQKTYSDIKRAIQLNKAELSTTDKLKNFIEAAIQKSKDKDNLEGIFLSSAPFIRLSNQTSGDVKSYAESIKILGEKFKKYHEVTQMLRENAAAEAVVVGDVDGLNETLMSYVTGKNKGVLKHAQDFMVPFLELQDVVDNYAEYYNALQVQPANDPNEKTVIINRCRELLSALNQQFTECFDYGASFDNLTIAEPLNEEQGIQKARLVELQNTLKKVRDDHLKVKNYLTNLLTATELSYENGPDFRSARDKLFTLTQDYLTHLQANKKIEDAYDEKVQKKITLVTALKNVLENRDLSAYKQVNDFHDLLSKDDTKQVLSKHRDGFGTRFLLGVLDALRIVACLVPLTWIPLAIYCYNKDKVTFFSTPKGETFVDQAEKFKAEDNRI